MYTVAKGPSQIVAKTRRGLAQKLESLDTIRDMTRKSSDSDDTADSPNSMSPPRPVFHAVANGKRHRANWNSRSSHHHHTQHQYHYHHHHHPQPETLTPQQEELIRYIYRRWQRVHKELSSADQANCTGDAANSSNASVMYYNDPGPNPALQDFEPFDLEGWWGRRLYHTLTQSS